MKVQGAHEPSAAVRDEQILARMAQGEAAAVADLYDCYGRLVYALTLKIVGEVGLAEDLVQDVFLRAWRAAATYRPELGTVRAWLLTIAHHRAIDEIRRRRRESGWISIDAMGEDHLGSLDDSRHDPLLSRALQALPPEQRQIIQLAYFHGLTMSEIAARLDLALGTVKSRTRLALVKLRVYLGADQDTDS